MCCIIPGITGVVSIDENGDRNADYSLLDMNPDNGKFEVRLQSKRKKIQSAEKLDLWLLRYVTDALCQFHRLSRQFNADQY